MFHEASSLGERNINEAVHSALSCLRHSAKQDERAPRQMNVPRMRPERHKLPDGFVDGVGADDASINWRPKVLPRANRPDGWASWSLPLVIAGAIGSLSLLVVKLRE